MSVVLFVVISGMKFNSIIAIEEHANEINPLVNPGAIAAVSLLKGNATEKWSKIKQVHDGFAGRTLKFNAAVYVSEASSNLRNQAIAHLLLSYGRLYSDPIQV